MELDIKLNAKSNKINNVIQKKRKSIKTDNKTDEYYKSIPRKFIDCFFEYFKIKLGLERKNINKVSSEAKFSNFRGNLYDLVHHIEIAEPGDFSSVKLFITEFERIYKKIFSLKPGIKTYSKFDVEFCEQSIKRIKFYLDVIKGHFIYENANGIIIDHEKIDLLPHDDKPENKNIIKRFIDVIELVINKDLKKKSLNEIRVYAKSIGLNSNYYFCFLKALRNFINEFCETKRQDSLIDLLDILPNTIKEIKNNINAFNLLQIETGLKNESGVFKSDRKFYIRYINIILLKSVLNSFEKTINKLSEGNEIILKTSKQMLVIFLETRIVKEYLSELLIGDKITRKILDRVIYCLIKSEPMDKLFSLESIVSWCKMCDSDMPEFYKRLQEEFYK